MPPEPILSASVPRYKRHCCSFNSFRMISYCCCVVMLRFYHISSLNGSYLRLRPKELRVQEQEQLGKLRQIHPEVDLAYDLVQQFAQILRTRTGEHLDAWLAQVERSNLPELQSFAAPTNCATSGSCCLTHKFGSGTILVRSSSVNEDNALGEERKW